MKCQVFLSLGSGFGSASYRLSRLGKKQVAHPLLFDQGERIIDIGTPDEVPMPSYKTLDLVATKRPILTNKDPIVARRNRLLSRVGQQIEIVDAVLEGKPIRRDQRRLAKWWWQEGDRYFVAVYHARQPIELAKGKWSIQCSDFSCVGDALRKLAAMIEAGEFDAVVAERATAVRARFGKAQAA